MLSIQDAIQRNKFKSINAEHNYTIWSNKE